MFGIQANPEDMIGANCANAAEETKDYFKDPDQFIERITEILENQETVLSDELQIDGWQNFGARLHTIIQRWRIQGSFMEL